MTGLTMEHSVGSRIRRLPGFARRCVGLLFALVPVVAPLRAEESGRPPNILFISIDDLRPELGAYGGQAITPHLDRLADRGLRFDRAYATQAVCGPSRLSVMAGLYPERTGLRRHDVKGWRERIGDVPTLNAWLGEHGYTTIGLGKVFHERDYEGADGPNWTLWIDTEQEHYLLPESLRERQENRREGKKVRGPSTESADLADVAYVDGKRAMMGAAILDQLGGNAPGPLSRSEREKPFFLAVGFQKPHLPFVAPRRYWEPYDRASLSLPEERGLPPGYPPAAANPRPGELYNYADIPRNDLPVDFPEALERRLFHGYLAATSYADANAGVLLEALERNGLAENTIVIVWGDHGFKLGEHGSWTKHTNLEIDNRVPLLVYSPGHPEAVGSTAALVELIDLYPTVCDWIGLPVPPHVQGRSFAKLLADPEGEHRESAYSSFPVPHPDAFKMGHSIRTRHHRYTEWWDGRDRRVESVLTNLEVDPGETTAVDDPSQETAHSEILRRRVLEAR